MPAWTPRSDRLRSGPARPRRPARSSGWLRSPSTISLAQLEEGERSLGGDQAEMARGD